MLEDLQLSLYGFPDKRAYGVFCQKVHLDSCFLGQLPLNSSNVEKALFAPEMDEQIDIAALPVLITRIGAEDRDLFGALCPKRGCKPPIDLFSVHKAAKAPGV